MSLKSLGFLQENSSRDFDPVVRLQASLSPSSGDPLAHPDEASCLTRSLGHNGPEQPGLLTIRQPRTAGTARLDGGALSCGHRGDGCPQRTFRCKNPIPNNNGGTLVPRCWDGLYRSFVLSCREPNARTLLAHGLFL